MDEFKVKITIHKITCSFRKVQNTWLSNLTSFVHFIEYIFMHTFVTGDGRMPFLTCKSWHLYNRNWTFPPTVTFRIDYFYIFNTFHN